MNSARTDTQPYTSANAKRRVTSFSFSTTTVALNIAICLLYSLLSGYVYLRTATSRSSRADGRMFLLLLFLSAVGNSYYEPIAQKLPQDCT
jgi:hypothetical protein